MKNINQKNIEKVINIFIVLLVFGMCFTWSATQPYNCGPDEVMKYQICNYIVQNNKLPHGGDEAVRDITWGISYGFTPILAYMFSALFMKITMLFTNNEFYLVVAARFSSVLSITLMAFFVTKIADKLFKRNNQICIYYCNCIFTTNNIFRLIY